MTRLSTSKSPMAVLSLERTSYEEAYHLQRFLLEKRILNEIPDTLIFTEHSPVITLGSASDWGHLLRTDAEYELLGIEIYTTDRGGGVTYHGPGQVLCYPILKLEGTQKDLHLYLRNLEKVALEILKVYHIIGKCYPGITGVFIEDRKIAQFGIRVKQWVTMHGLSLNLFPNLNHFRTIIPCGLEQFKVTSLAGELGYRPDYLQVLLHLCTAFEEVFGKELQWLSPVALAEYFPTLLPTLASFSFRFLEES
jgi:lipoyl(octanoyl) transferase